MNQSLNSEITTADLKDTLLPAALEHQAARAPNTRALVDDREAVTWAGLSERVQILAESLAGLGLQPGERIGLHGLSSIELAATFLACWRAALVTVLLSPSSKGPELAQELSTCGAVAYLADPDLYPVGEAIFGRCPTLRLALLLKRGALLPEVTARLPGRVSPGAEPESLPPELAAILFSSGTTGVPKGVMHTHKSLAAMGWPTREFRAASGEAVLAFAPLGYIPSLFVLAQCLFNGCTIVLLRRPDPEALLDWVEAHRCVAVWALSPVTAHAVLAAQTARPRNTESCRAWPVGGDAVPPRVLQAWPAQFHRELLQGFSLTECFPTLSQPCDGNRPNSMGVPWPGLEIRLVSAAGTKCEPREVGEIQLRAPWLFAGYWNDPEATARVMAEGWFHTGDLAHRDADGYYWFRGRLKQIIACDGEKISPQHVENALLEHADVVEAGVVGRPDKLHGEVPVAFARLRPGATVNAATLRDFVAGRVEDCGVPEEIHFIETLPRGRAGKVDRRALREQVVKRTEAGV